MVLFKIVNNRKQLNWSSVGKYWLISEGTQRCSQLETFIYGGIIDILVDDFCF